MPINDFSYTILEYINNAIRNSSVKAVNLGGVASSGGGAGIPPGGFVGYLPQTRVAYDMSELSANGLPESGWSLLDNLNHIRYDIDEINAVISGGDLGGGHIIQDEGITVVQQDILNFVGGGVTVTNISSIIENDTLPIFDYTNSNRVNIATTYLEWTHVLGSGAQRIVIVGTAMRVATATSVTFNGVSMHLIRRDKPGTDVCSELWYLLEDELPVAGTYTVRVNASESQQWSAGSVSFSNCSGLVDAVGVGANGSAAWGSVALPITDYQMIVDICAMEFVDTYLDVSDEATELWEKSSAVQRGAMSYKKNADGGTYEGSVWIFGGSGVWTISAIAIRGGASLAEATTVTISGASNTMPDLDAGEMIIGGRVNPQYEDILAGVTLSVVHPMWIDGDYPLSNITDGNDSTYALHSGGNYFSISYHFDEVKYFTSMRFLGETANTDFQAQGFIYNDSIGQSIYNDVTLPSGEIIFPETYLGDEINFSVYFFQTPYNIKAYTLEFTGLAYDSIEATALTAGTDGQFLRVNNLGMPEWTIAAGEGEYLQIGDGIECPTTAYINIGDGDYVKLYEKWDDNFNIGIGNNGDVFSAGWGPDYDNIIVNIGDIDFQDHGYFINIGPNGIALNGDVTVSGTIIADNLSGTNTGDQVGDGITVLGIGTVADPFVAVTSGATGSFVSQDSKTVTVVNGLIVSIV
jgi:hypothetical protein